MKSYLPIKVLTLFALFALLLAFMSCGNPPPRNANTAQVSDAEALSSSTPLPKACADGSDNTQKINALYADLAKLETFDGDLADQLNGRPTPQPDPSPDGGPKNFSITFEEYETTAGGPKKIVMRLKGKIVGDENPHSPARKATKLTKLLKFMDRNMRQGCLDAVSLEPDGTYGEAKTLNERGFEWWSACEHPNMVCSDGSCRRDCSRKGPEPTPSQTPSPTPSPTPSESPGGVSAP